MSGMADASLALYAYAKVNLTLEVLGRRPDGYHQVRTVLQTISLADRLVFTPHSELVVEGGVEQLSPEEDLVWRAARALQQATGCQLGARILVDKNIPLASGLGGGSSDAAAALKGLNRLWGLTLTRPELHRIAMTLGTDVPYFLYGSTALAEGIGDSISPIPPMPPRWLVVTCPDVVVQSKTAKLYSLLEAEHFTEGHLTQRLLEVLQAGKPVEGILFNVFSSVAPQVFPDFENVGNAFREAGAKHVALSGTGPSVFALVAGEEEGRMIAEQMRQAGYRSYLATTL